MNREFVPYNIAVRLKELGFNDECFGYYVDGELRGINLGIEELGGIEPYYQRFGFHTLSNHDIFNSNKIVVTAPTFSQAFRWFRENYGLWFRPDYYDDLKEYNFQGNIHKLGNFSSLADIGNYNTCEEAELACLEKLLEIVESKKE